MLAQCRMEAGQDEAAYAAASAAAQLQPDWMDALATLGRAARNTGRLREAAAAFGRYLDLAAAAEEAAGSSQPPQQQEGAGRAPAAGSRQGGAAPTAQAAGQTAADGDEVAAVHEELDEVRQLLQLQLGHQVGLPGLRLLESHGAAAGPSAVAWEAGALLAWFLVQQGQVAGSAACCSDGVGPRGCGVHSSSSGACAPTAGTPSAAGGAAQPPLNRPARPWLRGSRVLELGSGGTGLVGLAAASLGADVTATDLPAVLPQLQAAIAANASLVATAGGSIRAAALDWQAPDCTLLSTPPGGPDAQYSWLLGADLVYSTEPVTALVAVVVAAAAHAQANGCAPLKILIAHKHRHEAVDDALLGGLRAAGLPLLPVLTDAGTRCKVWASDAARTALGLL